MKKSILFRFYCDESYDGTEPPNTLAISGFFSDQPTWNKVERDWNEINHRYGVCRFHANPLNRKEGEYNGWDNEKRDQYSADLLNAINRQGNKIVAYNCGMRADKYRNIISETGRDKLGEPWFACFKACIAMIARHMEESNLPANWQFDVLVDAGSGFDTPAHKFFRWLQENPEFQYRHRLGTCISAKAKQCVGLQVADLMAYEYFKRLQQDNKTPLRLPMQLIQNHNHYEEGFFGEDTLKNISRE